MVKIKTIMERDRRNFDDMVSEFYTRAAALGWAVEVLGYQAFYCNSSLGTEYVITLKVNES